MSAASFPPPWLPGPPREARWARCLYSRWMFGVSGLTALVLSGSCYMVERAEGSDPLLHLLMRVLLILGVSLLYIWLRSGLRVRLLLRDGEASPGEVVAARRVVGVNPNPLSLRYRFESKTDGMVEHRHWLPLGSPLAQQLLAGEQPDLVVLHDVDGRSRVVQASDFEDQEGRA